MQTTVSSLSGIAIGTSISTSIHDRFRRAIINDDLVNVKRLFAHAVTLSTLAASHPTPYNYRQPGGAQAIDLAESSKNPKSQYAPASLRAAQSLYAASHGEPFDVRNISLEAPLGDERRQSSLILAVEKGASIELIEWLLDMGHDTQEPSKDSDNNTVIAAAASHCRPDVIQLYCSNPNLDVPSLLDYSNNSEGKTALHLASLKGHVDVVRLLLDLGADIDLPDRLGNTPLHYAASWGHLTVVQLLIERGCSFAAVNAAGFTAADFSFTHSVKAAVEAFGRAQYEGRKRARKAERSASAAAQASVPLSSSPRANTNAPSPHGTPSRPSLGLQSSSFPPAPPQAVRSREYAGSESSYGGSVSGAPGIDGHLSGDWSAALISSPRSRGGSVTRSPVTNSSSALYTTDGRSTYRVVLPNSSPLSPHAHARPIPASSQAPSPSTQTSSTSTSADADLGLGSVASRMRMRDRMAMNEYMRHRAKAAPSTTTSSSTLHPHPHPHPSPHLAISHMASLPGMHNNTTSSSSGSRAEQAQSPLLLPYNTTLRSPSPSRYTLSSSTTTPTPPPLSPSALRSGSGSGSASNSPDVPSGGVVSGGAAAPESSSSSPYATHLRMYSNTAAQQAQASPAVAAEPAPWTPSPALSPSTEPITLPSSSTSANTLVPTIKASTFSSSSSYASTSTPLGTYGGAGADSTGRPLGTWAGFEEGVDGDGEM